MGPADIQEPGDLAVLGVGDADVDIYLEVDRIPARDEKVLARSAARFPGGMVANFLVAFRRLGMACGFNGVVGDDEFGRLTLADLEMNGVDVAGAVVRPGGTTYYCAILLDPSGEKALVVAPTDCLFPAPEEVSEREIRRARHVHTTAGDLATATTAAALAKRHGITVSLDLETTAAEDHQRVERLLLDVDVLFVGPGAARRVTGLDETEAAAGLLLRAGPRVVCLTLGARGVLVATPEGTIRVEAFTVPVVDSTGAGDCFAAGFVHGFLRGWPLERVARFATAVGGLSLARCGGHEGAPRIDEVEAFLKKHPRTDASSYRSERTPKPEIQRMEGSS